MSLLNVLSLFDGMSCGQFALNKAGIKFESYYASEIDKDAIFITNKNFPNTIQLGDVRNVDVKNLPKIDLLIGGSPCQNLSITLINNQGHNKGLDGEKSKLFYEYVRILREANPKYFLLENVGSMRKEDRDIITEVLGVEPILIDSSLVSAQNRLRYYWTNIPNVTQPEDRGLLIKDIILPLNEVDERHILKKEFTYHGDNVNVQATLHIKGHDILKRVYNLNAKCPTLTTCTGGNRQKKVFQDGVCRNLTPLEYERLQTVPDGATEGVSNTSRYNMLGNGWTIDVIEYIFKNLKDEIQ